MRTDTSDESVSVALVESIRRAVKRLADDGLVELATVPVVRDVRGGPRTKRMLAARRMED